MIVFTFYIFEGFTFWPNESLLLQRKVPGLKKDAEGDIFDQKVTLARDKREKKLFLMQIDDACDSTFFDDFLEVRKRGSKRQSWLEEVGREAFHRMHDRRGWYRGRRMEQGEGSKLCTGNTNIPLLPTSSFYANKFPQ